METHKNPISRKELIARFGQKSNLKGSIALFNNWICLIVTSVLITLIPRENFVLFTLSYIPLSFIAACCLRGFDNLTHEASHKNIFKEPLLHRLLEFSYAFVVFKTIDDYAPSHIRHHKEHRHNKDDDPDTQQSIRWGVEYLTYPFPLKTIYWLYVWRLIIGYYLYDHLKYNILPHLASRSAVVSRMLFWFIVIAIVTITHSWSIFLLVYIIPFLFWLPYIRFVAESSKHKNVHLETDFGNSRNNIGWIHRYFLHPHNDGYHQMHHYAAAIPFYNLRLAYKYCMQNDFFRTQVIESHNPLQTIKQSFKIKHNEKISH